MNKGKHYERNDKKNMTVKIRIRKYTHKKKKNKTPRKNLCEQRESLLTPRKVAAPSTTGQHRILMDQSKS